jgi:hypothetical protein
MPENQDLIIIEQLPIITQKFRDIAVAVKEKTALALAMPCTKETKQAVKDIRSDLNKDKAELEARRIAVKNAVMKPYNDMDAVYNTELKSVFDTTDAELKQRIAAIEDAEKAEKEANVKAYFAEYAASLGIKDIPYEAAKINMTLTLTEPAAKKQAKEWLDKYSISAESISTLDHAAEIMAEFKANGHNAIQAIQTVNARYAVIEREQQRIEAMKQQQEKMAEATAQVNKIIMAANVPTAQVQEAAQEAEAKVDAVIHIGAILPGAYAVITEHDPNEIVEVPFTVKDTRKKIRALREYMKVEGIHYEQR